MRRKNSAWQRVAGTTFCVVLVAGSFINSAVAANTHSVDLERSGGQLLSITDGGQIGLDLSSALTIEAWIKLESLPTAGQVYVIASKREGASDSRQYSFNLENFEGLNRLTLMLSHTGSNPDSTGRITWPSITTGTWYHVAATWSDATQKYTAYVNGVSIGSYDTTVDVNMHTIFNGSGAFRIGAEESSPINFFDGLIDEVRVWNVARTETQIASDISHELVGNEAGLVGYWKLNNSLTDSTSNGNNLTDNGGVVYSSDKPFDSVPPPPPFSEVLNVRKATSENSSNSSSLHSDSQLKLSLGANKTYVVDGVIFVSATKAKPDVKISFLGQSGSTVMLGYITDKDGGVLTSGAVSPRIVLPANTPIPIQIKGTIKTGSTAGDVEFKWAQATSNAALTTVLEGSYLRAEEI